VSSQSRVQTVETFSFSKKKKRTEICEGKETWNEKKMSLERISPIAGPPRTRTISAVLPPLSFQKGEKKNEIE
jgi:hypothetical protein